MDADTADVGVLLDQRRALQLLSHRARTRRLRAQGPVKYSFVVLLEDRR
jgi:hypothetical protein